jgi:hypothetical protein
LNAPKPRHAFIAGLHRSGTSLLHRCLCDHPDISGFHDTGVPEDEGQHLQSVFPTARVYGGPGRFGFDRRSHLDEGCPLVTPENRVQLDLEWGRHWDLTRPVRIEKSPPNLVRTRFLQALFPDATFIILMRHPLAVAYATQKWSRTSLGSLLDHWLVCHRRLYRDLPYLDRAILVRYEDFVRNPGEILVGLYRFLGVPEHSLAREISQDVNASYFGRWRQAVLAGPIPDRLRAWAILLQYEWRLSPFGYSLWRPASLGALHPQGLA